MISDRDQKALATTAVKRDICLENAQIQGNNNLMEEEVEGTDLKKDKKGKSPLNMEAPLLGETNKSRASTRKQNHLGMLNLNGVTQLVRNLPLNNGMFR